jgi:tetratricopeptide (TPR) repeat protein
MTATRKILWGVLLAVVAIGCGRPPQAHLEKAAAYLREKKFDRAEKHLHLVVNAEPENAQAFNLLGIAQQNAGKPQDAAVSFQRALELASASKLDDDAHIYRHNLGIALYNAGEFSAAAAELARVPAKNATADTFEYLGLAHLHAGNFDDAQRAFRELLKFRPKDPETLNHLGIIAARKRDFRQAERWFADALAQNPKLSEARLNLAVLLHGELNRKNDALPHYQQFIAEHPDREDVRLVIAALTQETPQKKPTPTPQGGVAAAKPTPEPPPVEAPAPPTKPAGAPKPEPAPEKPAEPPVIATAKPPPPPPPPAPTATKRVRTKKPIPTLREGDRAKAVEAFNDGVRLHRDGRLNDAVAAYHRSTRLDPTFATAYYNLAIAYRALGLQERALEAYDWALAANPNYNDARFNQAILLQELGYLDEAAENFEVLARANPRDATVQWALAKIYERDPATRAKARAAYETFLKLEPTSPLAREARAWLAANR